jgi:hypothetical protein
MEKPITVSFRWTAKEMLLAQGLHMRYSKMGRRLRWSYMGGGGLFILLGIAGLVRQKEFFASAFPFFVFAAIFLAMPLFTRRAVLKVYAQKPDRDMLVTYEISAERIASRTEIGSSDMLWRAIVRVHRVPEGFLLYPSERMFHWLPMYGFQEAADVERLTKLTKAIVPKYDEVV